MLKKMIMCAAIVGLLFALVPTAQAAAAITFLGTDETTRDAYRTTDVIKPLDVDGDNVYGTYGSHKSWQTATNANPAYATVNALGIAWVDASLEDVDDATVATGPAPISNTDSGMFYIAGNTEKDFFRINVTLPVSSFNLTVFADMDPVWWDQMGQQIRIRQTAGGAADTGLINVSATVDGAVDWHVFSISGAKPGDQFVYSQVPLASSF